MAESQISRELIPCFVLQQNNQQFISSSGVIGKVLDVPCKEVLIDKDLYWFRPVKDDGIFSALSPCIALGDNTDKPTFDSILVQRVRDKLTDYVWWFYVIDNNTFKNSCNTCCGDATIPMPGVDGGFQPVIAPCQLICDMINGDGDLYALFGLPTLAAGQQYYPTGSYNNIALSSSGATFASVAALLVYLNANWTNIGSPNVTFVWTAIGITLTATGGNSGDSLCVTIRAIAPSP